MTFPQLKFAISRQYGCKATVTVLKTSIRDRNMVNLLAISPKHVDSFK
ncbi:hypothetical protein JCM19235_1752 [Vibrio maritimus]|uniref:Uncharacterized protein n=1 Tax=Vibrio maritimus TaxID=990268 RepID=A0A090S305_9VIBR|nr:hypothetical protein JCM19235_1752 [Vibrio maritimus]